MVCIPQIPVVRNSSEYVLFQSCLEQTHPILHTYETYAYVEKELLHILIVIRFRGQIVYYWKMKGKVYILVRSAHVSHLLTQLRDTSLTNTVC